MRKPELYKLVKLHRPKKEYQFDKLFKEAGHEVIRLPPYHSELNPIELCWAYEKIYVERNKTINTKGTFILNYLQNIYIF